MRFCDAVVLAVNAHEGQKYGSEYYDTHLDDVYKTYKMLFGEPTERTACIIYLHDVLEDTHVTPLLLEKKGMLSEDIEVVKLLTKSKLETKEEYLTRLSKDIVALKVKIADSTANYLFSLKTEHSRRTEKYHDNLKFLWKQFNEAISK